MNFPLFENSKRKYLYFDWRTFSRCICIVKFFRSVIRQIRHFQKIIIEVKKLLQSNGEFKYGDSGLALILLHEEKLIYWKDH